MNGMKASAGQGRGDFPRFFLLLLILIVPGFCLSAQSSAQTTAASPSWVLAASPFAVKSYTAVKDNEQAAARLLPSLILDQFSSGYIRVIPPGEAQGRSLRSLQISQQALFQELINGVKKRDAVVLENRSPRTVKKRIAEEEKKVAAIKEKIDVNIREIQKLLPEFVKEESQEKTSFFARLFRKKEAAQAQSSVPDEPITIWKNNEHELFTIPKDSDSKPAAGAALEKALLDVKINGLITGTIMVQDEYAAVQAELRVYPGGELLGSALEIGRITDTALISRSLIFSFLPHIANSLPANLQFEVNPPEVRAALHINIDDTVLSSIPESYLVPNGVHQLSFEAEGYNTETLNMHFAGGATYQIQVDMREKTLEAISLTLKREAAGMFLINAMPAAGPPVSVEVSGQSVLGIFDPGEGGFPGFFVIPPEAENSAGKTWTVQPNVTDVAAQIEQSRKIMYISYSIFMTSLPVLAYFMGESQKYVSGYNAAQMGVMSQHPVSLETAEQWIQYRNISIGATVALGVNFFAQLFVYLYRANGVVPVTAQLEK